MLTDAQQLFNARAEYKGIYAEITVAYNVAADAHKAVAQLETLIGTRLDDAEASIHTLQTAQSTHEQAFAQYQQTVAAKFGEQESAIQQVQTATADVAGALAEYKTHVAAQFDQQSAAIEQKMTSTFNHAGGSATYSLKAGVTYNGLTMTLVCSFQLWQKAARLNHASHSRRTSSTSCTHLTGRFRPRLL